MSNKFNKLKNEYLKTLTEKTDNKEQKLKDIIGIKSNKESKNLPLRAKKNFKPIALTCSLVAMCLIVVITIVSIVNFNKIPVYKEMFASNIGIERNNQKSIRKKPNMTEDELLDQIGVIYEEGISCYANPDEEVLITIKLDNPEFYEILSFTLNGRKYQSFEFESGSNSSQIVVKYKARSQSGIESITIDAIKYVNGENIRNARFDGNRTIELGVTYQYKPNVSDVNAVGSLTDYGLSIEVKDEDNIINPENGIYLYLFADGKLVRSDKLNIGRTFIPYSNLHLGTRYEYIVVGVYDLLDGKGKRANVLARKSFTTDEGFTYANVEATYDSVNFDLLRSLKFDGIISKIDLYKGEEVVDTVTKPYATNEKYGFENLLSNTEYKMIATYEYKITENEEEVTVTKQIEYVFSTLERPTPTLEVIEALPNKRGITYALQIEDTTTVGKVVKIEVYNLKGNVETLVTKFDENITEIIDLLSNNDYKIYITYQYDLLDGTGEKLLTIEYEFKTLPLEEAVVTVKDVIPGKKNFTFAYDILDNDNVAQVVSYSALLNDEVVDTISSLDVLEFTNLLSDNDYVVSVNYTYDLNDGEGIHEGKATCEVHTLPLEKPKAYETKPIVAFNDTAYIWITLEDSDMILNFLRMELYKDGVLVKTINEFDNLNPKEPTDGKQYGDIVISGLETGEYQLVLVYEYDLNDGEETHLVDINHPYEDNKCKFDI